MTASRKTHLPADSKGSDLQRIGVVSDTHNNVSNTARIVELFNDAGVDAVVHTGDVTQPKTLDVLARLDAPLFGVWGNNDVERKALEASVRKHRLNFCDGPLIVEWSSRRIIVIHDPEDLPPETRASANLVLHGHTHRCVMERNGAGLVFNPGECAGHMKGRNAVGIVDLRTLRAELLHF